MGTPIESSSLVFKTREFYLSGSTDSAKGSTLTFEELDNTLIFLSQSIGTGGSGIYEPAFSNETTMPNSVGGISSGSTAGDLRGNTFTEMFDLLLFPVLSPNRTIGSFSSTVSSPSIAQVGTTQSVVLTSTFNRGTWTVAGQSPLDYYGSATNYYFTSGSTTVDTSTANTHTFNNYKVLAGPNNFTTAVSYSIGDQPVFSNGAPSGSPVPSGALSDNSNSFTGVYPYFYGYADTRIIDGLLITQSNISTLVQSETNPTLINYNFTGKYLYFAYPQSYGQLTEGKNGSGFNIIPTLEINAVNISHPLGYWTNIPYYIYIGSITNGVLGPTDVPNETWTFST